MAEQHLMALAKPLLPQGFLQTSWTCQWQQQRSRLVTPEATLRPLSPRAAAVRSEKKGVQLSYETLAAIACSFTHKFRGDKFEGHNQGAVVAGNIFVGRKRRLGLELVERHELEERARWRQ
jgi:hypothetical protein